MIDPYCDMYLSPREVTGAQTKRMLFMKAAGYARCPWDHSKSCWYRLPVGTRLEHSARMVKYITYAQPSSARQAAPQYSRSPLCCLGKIVVVKGLVDGGES